MKHHPFLTKVIAGGLTAVISPLAAFTITADSDLFKIPKASETSDALNQADINNGELILYSPLYMQIEKYEQDEDEDDEAEVLSLKSETGVISQNISSEPEDFTIYTAGSSTVKKTTFGSNSGSVKLVGGGTVNNTTEISDDVLLNESTKPLEFEIKKNTDEPQVLIIHTHTSESFRPSDDLNYTADYPFRTADSDKNIVAVGARIAAGISEAGFTVIHDGTVHDSPYNGSYGRSSQTVKAILAEYPSIKLVLDIHRDAIESDEHGEKSAVAAVTSINGKDAAQIMIIAAADTDDGEWGVPDFMQNFRLASKIQSRTESDNPSLTRAILFQYCNYNMHLSTGALLIEIGSHGNTLEEALYAGDLLGKSIGALLDELAE